MADATDTRLQEVEKSIETLETRMREQIATAEGGKRTTLVVGIILIGIIFGYLMFLTVKLREYANPTDLAGMIDTTANELVQNKMPELADALIAEAPNAVQSMREQAVAQVPKVRAMAEEKTLVLVDKLTTKLETDLDKLVAEMIKAHKGELTPLIEAAMAKDGNADLEKAFQKSMEDLLGPEVDKLFADYDKYMAAAEAKLEYYSQPDEKLTSDERAHKYLIIAVLGFINETVAQPKGDKPTADVKTPAKEM